jgi:hypothetical protein
MNMKKLLLLLSAVCALSACKNDDWGFPDSDRTTVYFAYQYPVRTITFGEDIFDTSLDNARKCQIMASWGGGYENKKDVTIDFEVDQSIATNLNYLNSNGSQVRIMPSNYYTLSSNRMVIPKGSISGGVEVQLTDAFFADPLALRRNYVIPVVIKSVTGADSVLRGRTTLANPRRVVASDWNVIPKDYVLYAIKYINTWEANYLRRGVDVVTTGTTSQNVVRHQPFVENDEVLKLTTLSLTQLQLPLTFKNSAGTNVPVSLTLQFNNNGQCTISSATANVTATGTGQFVKRGEKKSWGDKDRDALYLNYEVTVGTSRYATRDTLVVRDRGVAKETFDVVPR